MNRVVGISSIIRNYKQLVKVLWDIFSDRRFVTETERKRQTIGQVWNFPWNVYDYGSDFGI